MTVQSDLTTCMTLLQGGRQKAAYDAARKAMGRHKTQPEFPNIAGIALCGNGKYAEGIQYFKKALKSDNYFLIATTCPARHDDRRAFV